VKIRLLICVLVVGLGTTAGATLVAPPSLDELVARADVVFEGTVVDVRSSWRETREGRVIMSDVTFRVARGFKGDPSQQVVLEMFGGTIGKDTMRIAGMPAFALGDHDVLFVRRGDTSGLPLVGLMYGRFKVSRTPAGQDMVTTFDGRAINGIATIGTAPRARAEVGTGMTLDTFAAEISQRVRGRNAANR
jgi:hypothetical protein